LLDELITKPVCAAAHTVIIKGVKLFQANAWQEYSDLDIIQMMGRAVSHTRAVMNKQKLSI
jgi:hypothetical protein